jgi:biopolymer transport protein ExbB/TolQ
MPTHTAGRGLDLLLILTHATLFGKLVFLILIACSVVSIAVIVERYLVLRRVHRTIETDLTALAGWAQAHAWDEGRRVVATATRDKNPLFSVLRLGIAYWQELGSVGENRTDVKESMVNAAIERELKLVRAMLRTRLSILANVASVAPFIGLFGTVTGIIATFDSISRTGTMGQDLVASGIAEALVATALGLFAAIPAVVGYNAFVDQINNMILAMEESALERIYFLVQREGR